MSFWGELKRRNVFKVGAAYVIVAWLIVQVANTFFPILHLPDWAVTLVAVLLILGLAVTLIIAWAFELTAEGVKKTEHVPIEESITHVTGKKLDYILGGLLLIAVAYILFDNYYLDRRVVQTDSPKTIAVLPFDDLSPEKDQGYFVLGLSEEILNYLSNIKGFHVTSKTSAFAFKETNKTVQEIAEILGRDYILEGSVRKAGNELRITAQLIQAADDRHLWSKTYDKEFKVEEMFSVQEDIATAVADELKVALGIGESFKQLGGTDNKEAYEFYLLAKGQGDEDNALESIDAAISLDPKFALAWVLKANTHASLIKFVSADRAIEERNEAQRAVMKAIELEPNLVVAYASLGNIKSYGGEFVEAGRAYKKATELSTEPLWGLDEYIGHLLDVCYFEKADTLTDSYWRSDPLNVMLRAGHIETYSYLGDIQGAEKEYEQFKEVFGSDFYGNLLITMARLGSGNIVSPDEILISSPVHDAAKEFLDFPNDGLAELHRLYPYNAT